MLFSLEALQAGKGDCLILHYGTPAAPRFIVIDGGPAGIYSQSLEPRLRKLSRKWSGKDGQLPIDMLVVSHIDDDHIRGVNDWMRALQDGESTPCRIATLWYNSFDAILGNAATELRTRVAAFTGASAEESGAVPLSVLSGKVITASVAQGRELRERADAMGIPLNLGFDGLAAAQTGANAISRPDGLKLRVVAPSIARLRDLQKDWDENVRANPDPVVAAAFADRSVPNLSSIVMVAELHGKRMLLTGDARGDEVQAGLKSAGLLDAAGKAHFDLIKMPHHGSCRNMTAQWLQQITADHYVISANGEHGNPDPETIQWLCEARGDAPYTIYMTNQDMVDPKGNKQIGKLVSAALASYAGVGCKVVYRKPANLSVQVDLFNKVGY
jgi:hypothetical protein